MASRTRRSLLNRVFRPVYSGPYFSCTPRHWWNPRERRSARIASAVANAQAPDTAKIVSDMAIYGFAATDSSGRRIDPTTMRVEKDG